MSRKCVFEPGAPEGIERVGYEPPKRRVFGFEL
jgi:hypothetical protein